MLFNSTEFIFGFVPVACVVYYLLARIGSRWRLAWLFAASLFFYGWWNPVYVPLLLLSIGVNFVLGDVLATRRPARKVILAIGVAFNLGLLGYFKYADFFVQTVGAVTGTDISLPHIVLPLAISFFTFQQIAFLVDTYRGLVGRVTLVNYAVFVTFFPQLIAGPIVHHSEMMPQFAACGMRLDAGRIAVALSVFTVGLFKKAVIADGLAPIASAMFAKAETGEFIAAAEALLGTLAYTFQLYFDFSGYSDMAIGLGLLFGISLPVNFRAPYRAHSIIEFWRRWHITLSRFLRDYLYVPLGGNRKGPISRYRNLMITMLLGGLWHGAGWTFVIWGGLHGLYLLVNHVWQAGCRRFGWAAMPRTVAVALTFLAVASAWVFFRAETLSGALSVFSAMAAPFGLDGWSGSLQTGLDAAPNKLEYSIGLLVVAAGIAFLAPSVADYFLGERARTGFRADLAHLVFVLGLWVVIIATVGESSEFLYFQF